MMAWGAECCTVVLTMVIVILRELIKVRVEAKIDYGLENPSVMVGQYFWGTAQLHIVMYEFLRAQFRKHPEVDPHTMLYLFEHGEPQVEVSDLKKTVEAQ